MAKSMEDTGPADGGVVPESPVKAEVEPPSPATTAEVTPHPPSTGTTTATTAAATESTEAGGSKDDGSNPANESIESSLLQPRLAEGDARQTTTSPLPPEGGSSRPLRPPRAGAGSSNIMMSNSGSSDSIRSPNSTSGKGKPKRSSHRRANSYDGIPLTIPVPNQQQQQQQHRGAPPYQQRRQQYGNVPPPLDYNQNLNHHRSYTWSDQPQQQQFPPGMRPPSPNYANRAPMAPFTGGSERGMVRPPFTPNAMNAFQQQKQRSRRKGGGHRRVHSTSDIMPGGGVVGGYGSMSEYGYGPGMVQQQPPQKQDFCPRDDFLSLTDSFRGNRGRSGSIGSIGSQNSAAAGVRHTPKTGGYRKVPGIDVTPNFGDPALVAGEAVYLLHKRSKPESTRKRNMRQQSAQIFMEEVKGEEQPPACRDVIFLLLFVFHLVYMVFLENMYGYRALEEHGDIAATAEAAAAADDGSVGNDDVVIINYRNLVFISVFSGTFAVVLSTTLLLVMTMFPTRFVQSSLVIAITLSFIWGTAGIGVSAQNMVPITGIIALALSVGYAFIVWDRIPFAAANLNSALGAVRDYPGTIVIAFVFQALALIWSVYYGIVVCGVYDAIQENELRFSPKTKTLVYFLLGMSYYWTFQVLQNTVQAATAQVVKRWWFSGPHGESVVGHSALRTIFYCMGSICFGSLFVGPAHIIRQLSVFFRPTSDEASLLCLHECLHCLQTCITRCVDRLSDAFNPWGFTYIGLYGYDFMSACRKATETFEKRGWKTIVSDDLVPNILLMTSLVIGGVTGIFALFMATYEDFEVISFGEQSFISFSVGLVIGLVLTSVLFAVISSSMNAVIVCFATNPVDFEEYHPELSHEMRAAWRTVWPGALDAIDLRSVLASNAANSGGYYV